MRLKYFCCCNCQVTELLRIDNCHPTPMVSVLFSVQYTLRLANKVKIIDLVDINENCISRGVADSATNIRYRCIKMKAKAPISKAWDNKDKAPPNAVSSWKKYSIKYIRALNEFGGNLTAYDAAILKGRANPQLAVFLLLYNFLNDQSRVFLCCTRPYLRNVHYSSVKEYFVNDALLWDSKYGLTVLKRRNFNSNASMQEALFTEYLSKYDLK